MSLPLAVSVSLTFLQVFVLLLYGLGLLLMGGIAIVQIFDFDFGNARSMFL